MTKALKNVRTYYYKNSLKSSNKMKFGGGDAKKKAEDDRVTAAGLDILRIRWASLHDTDTDEIQAITEGKARNCGELAKLAAYILREDFAQETARVAEFASSHQVALIGAGKGDLPSNMKDWNSDIYICDPWCNIACRATDYPDQFKAKMEKWQKADKRIKMDGDVRGFIPAMDQEWISKILNEKKEAL